MNINSINNQTPQINFMALKTQNYQKFKSIVNNALKKDIFIKNDKNNFKQKNVSEPVLKLIRDNPANVLFVIMTLIFLGVSLSTPLFMISAAGLALANLYANKLPNTINKYEDTVIDPIKDAHLTENQKITKSIFLEDYSEEEAKNIAKKYHRILKIKDKREFLQKAFNALKNDYKLQDIPIELKIGMIEREDFWGDVTCARLSTDTLHSKFYIKLYRINNNKSLLKILTHELHHVKQNILAYQASKSLEERIEQKMAFVKKDKKLLKIIGNSGVLSTIKKIVADEDKMMKNIGINQNSLKGKPLYEYSRKLFEDRKQNEHVSRTAYRSSFREIDAFRSSKMLLKLLKKNKI